jgi:hypothetical protein
MIAAPVQCHVDGIPKRSHYVRVPFACIVWLGGVIHFEETDRVIVVASVSVTLWQCRHRVNDIEARPLIGGNGRRLRREGRTRNWLKK